MLSSKTNESKIKQKHLGQVVRYVMKTQEDKNERIKIAFVHSKHILQAIVHARKTFKTAKYFYASKLYSPKDLFCIYSYE